LLQSFKDLMQRIRTLQQFLSRFPVACRVPVQWGEQDAFNHLNNVQYVRYMENARIKYFKALLLEINNPQPEHLAFNSGKGLGPILSEAYVKFLHPVLAGDTLVVGATGRLAEGSGSRLLLSHSMWSLHKSRVVAEGSSTVVSFNYAEGRVEDFLPAISGKCKHLLKPSEFLFNRRAPAAHPSFNHRPPSGAVVSLAAKDLLHMEAHFSQPLD
jgi:acyl-CoA thioester hydrolase